MLNQPNSMWLKCRMSTLIQRVWQECWTVYELLPLLYFWWGFFFFKSLCRITHLTSECLPALGVFTSKSLNLPKSENGDILSVSLSRVKLETALSTCICVISCLEQIGRLCLLMSLCWWVFSHHFFCHAWLCGRVTICVRNGYFCPAPV